MKVLALYGSSRKQGNSELLADKVLAGIVHTKRHLVDYHIEPIVDKRHDPEGFADIHDDYNRLICEFLEHDVFIFVTPVYWYGMSGLMKNFVDRWSQSSRDRNLHFKEKMKRIKPYVVIAGGDLPHQKAKPLVQQFELIFDFMGMKLEGWIIGDGDKPGEVLNDKIAMQTAEGMNAKLLNLVSNYGDISDKSLC